MQEAEVFMTEFQTLATVTEECQRLCSRLCEAEYSLPDEPAFRKDRVIKMLQQVELQAEARVVRDVMPLVVPSPELLHIDGHAGLSDVCEAVKAEWGISASAFTNEQKKKLELNHTSACPNLFLEDMYSPFLICEAKGSGSSIEEAERQAIHSASIAVRAVIQLYRKASTVMEVDRKILVFSVAHNAWTAKIFGHFARVDGENLTFLRHRVLSMDFAEDLLTCHTSQKRARAHEITRAIYDDFFPQHQQDPVCIVKTASAIAGLVHRSARPRRGFASIGAEFPTQEDGRFKKPPLPSTVLQLENDRLLEALREQKEQTEQQLAQHREESREQRAMMERQLAQ